MTNKRKKIMVADDDSAILEMITMMLDFDGYEVTPIADGNALLTLEDNLPDLMLLDIWMSGTDGRDICRQLKSKPATRHLPILLVSASKDIEQSALQSGADGFISKPFEMGDFLATIRAMLILPH